jgi:hypothetical protein
VKERLKMIYWLDLFLKIFHKKENYDTFALPKNKGSLAQLVQSICLTSRGSQVRTL